MDVNELALEAPRRNKMRRANTVVLGMPRIGGLLVKHARSGAVVLLDPRPVEQREPTCTDRQAHRPLWVTRSGWTRCLICQKGGG